MDWDSRTPSKYTFNYILILCMYLHSSLLQMVPAAHLSYRSDTALILGQAKTSIIAKTRWNEGMLYHKCS